MDAGEEPRVAVLVALEAELGPLAERVVGRRRVGGLELLELEGAGGLGCVACVGGIGKVRAARAATVLTSAAGPLRALLIVGVAGALVRRLAVGDLVHCTRAVQADLAVRSDRERRPEPQLLDAWRTVAPGPEGWFLTADRPVLSPWRRLRLARAFAGAAVADMETAAAAAVSDLAGVPWAALRAVSDGAGLTARLEFERNFPAQAGRAAATVPAVLARIAAGEGHS